MIDDVMRFDRRAALAHDSLLGRLDGRDSMRLDRQFSFDPSFESTVVALADRLRRAEPDVSVADLLPVVADEEWRRRTRGLCRLSQPGGWRKRAFWPANDRGSPTWSAGAPKKHSTLGISLVAFTIGFALTGAAVLVMAPEAGPLATLLQ